MGVVLTVVAASLAWSGGGGAAADDAGWSASVSPSTVTDGQAVIVTVKAAAGYLVNTVQIQLCRDGVNYQESTGFQPAPDFGVGGPNCPIEPVSSSGDRDRAYIVGDRANRPEGTTFRHRIGSGTVSWTPFGTKTEVSLTCDPDHPCLLVVEAQVTRPDKTTIWQPRALRITYAKEDPFGGCGGPADGVVISGGSDRMSDAWVGWTVAECKQPGRSGAATRTAFAGEGPGIEAFAAGNVDLTYSAGGYDDAMGLLPKKEGLPNDGRRPAVNIPIGLNAAVLAVGGGHFVDGNKVPYTDIKLTAAEVALILSGGEHEIVRDLSAVRARNPEFGPDGNRIFNGGGFQVGAVADADASSWYTTRWLKQVVPDAWKVPNVGTYGANAGRPRGIDVWLAKADPDYTFALSLLSGRTAIQKGLVGESVIESGGPWVLTDLMTARALGLTPVQIQNSQGDFVAPTPESLAAAVPKMTADPYGILGSDPKAVAAKGQVQPYPLTFVEYAVAPTEALLNEDCSARTASQKLLTGWLAYATGPGQDKLTPGMAPLPADLRAVAAKGIPKVGAATPTGACAPKPTTTTTTKPRPTTTSTTKRVVPVTSTIGPSPVIAVAAPPAPASYPVVEAATPTTTSETVPALQLAPVTAASSERPAGVALPAFAGRASTELGGSVLALLGIMVIGAVPALRATGRPSIAWRRTIERALRRSGDTGSSRGRRS